MTALATSNFSLTENPLSTGWTTLTSESGMQSTGGVCTPSNSSVDCCSRYSGVTWPNDQYSKIKATVSSGETAGAGTGVAVRCSTSAETFYRLVINGDGEWELLKFSAGSTTSLLSGTATYSAGAYLELDIQSTTLTVIYNGSSLGTKVDATISTGQAGVAYSSTINTTRNSDDWEGGDFSSGDTLFGQACM